jgi:hypothetical protein
MVNAFYGISTAALAGGSTFCFLVVRVFLAADQQRVWSLSTRDVLRLGTYDPHNAQLEFFNGFDSRLLLHCSTPRISQTICQTERPGKLTHNCIAIGSLASSIG